MACGHFPVGFSHFQCQIIYGILRTPVSESQCIHCSSQKNEYEKNRYVHKNLITNKKTIKARAFLRSNTQRTNGYEKKTSENNKTVHNLLIRIKVDRLDMEVHCKRNPLNSIQRSGRTTCTAKYAQFNKPRALLCLVLLPFDTKIWSWCSGNFLLYDLARAFGVFDSS